MPGARELRNAHIVGTSCGIGLATVKRFNNDLNLRIYAASRTCSEELLRSFRFIRTDVTSNASVNNLCEEVLRDCNKLDILIHAAGNAVAGPIEDTSIEEAQAQFDTNFWGVVRVTSGLLPSMRRSGGGLIIVIGSMAGMIPLPFQAYYSASKFALEDYCESLAFEVAPYGIRVCLIQPGDIKTDFTANGTMARRFSHDSPYGEVPKRRGAKLVVQFRVPAKPENFPWVEQRMKNRKKVAQRFDNSVSVDRALKRTLCKSPPNLRSIFCRCNCHLAPRCVNRPAES